MAAWRVARVMGIPIEIHASWTIVFAFLGSSLSLGYFPLAYPGQSGLVYGILGVVTTLLVFASLLLHELSHSLVAREHNLPIARITLFIFGGVAHARGEPPGPRAEFRIAIAGPLASLLVALLARLVQEGARIGGLGQGLEAVLGYLYGVNLMLALVNLVPAFPLDGGRILRALLWSRTGSLLRATRWAARLGRGFAHLLILAGLFLVFFGPWLNGLWSVFLGWFLLQAAQGSEVNVELTETLRGLTVADVMEPQFLAVRREMPLDHFVDRYLTRSSQEVFPVMDGAVPLGVVGLSEIRQVAREEWPQTTVQSVRRPLEPLQLVAPSLPAMEAARRLAVTGTPLLVVEDGQLVGLVTARGLSRLIDIRREVLMAR